MTNKKRPDLVREGERLDDLQLGGLELIQNPGQFCFGVDAVLLSDFARVKPGETVLDMEPAMVLSPSCCLRRQRESTLQDWKYRKIRQKWPEEACCIIILKTE